MPSIANAKSNTTSCSRNSSSSTFATVTDSSNNVVNDPCFPWSHLADPCGQIPLTKLQGLTSRLQLQQQVQQVRQVQQVQQYPSLPSLRHRNTPTTASRISSTRLHAVLSEALCVSAWLDADASDTFHDSGEWMDETNE